MIKMYHVGGFVRDQIRGVKSNDIDYAVEAPSYAAMKEHILSLGAEIFVEHEKFVTIRGRLANQPCDFTLCRRDGEYLDNRHPTSCEVGTIHDDLARRDFTMNAIAIDLETKEVIDPFNGTFDIKRNIIRAVGNPYKRFKEDSLRILRAMRFSITLGYEIDSVTESAMFDKFDLLENISAERIKDELHKMFAHNSVESFRLLYPYGRDRLKYIFNDRTKIWLEPTMKEK